MSYTKGPWTVSDEWDEDSPDFLKDKLRVSAGRWDVAYIAMAREDGSTDEEMANALLVSAAPDMAEALLSVVKIWGYALEELEQDARDALAVCRAALAKAGL